MRYIKKYMHIISSIIAVSYTAWYMHFADPLRNSGALSNIGLKHPVLFAVWGVCTFFALSINVCIAYRKYLNTKVYIPLLCIAAAALTLFLVCRFDYRKETEYFLHCAGSLIFSVIIGVTVFLFFFLLWKKGIYFKCMTAAVGFILITDLIFLMIYKENGLIETVPIFLGYLILGITNLKKERKTVELK